MLEFIHRKIIVFLSVISICYGTVSQADEIHDISHTTTPDSPCSNLEQRLTIEQKSALTFEIAKQLQTTNIDLLKSFSSGRWSIIYVSQQDADEAVLFYSDDPITSSFITLWSGAAVANEEQEIKDWALKSASGIPPKLASCFAWYVTKGR